MKKNHCCNQMNNFLDEKKVCVGYDPTIREYYINLNGSNAIQIIQFCPWCGEKLPKNLSKEYFRILKKTYNIKHMLGIMDNPNIPEEFKTDEWWKKRGL
jgi:hypothetical protein